MPRKYIRKEGARRYGYSVEAMSQAVADVKNNVYRHLRYMRQEESLLVHALKKLGECGFGIDREAVN